jgi:hypothetical protein
MGKELPLNFYTHVTAAGDEAGWGSFVLKTMAPEPVTAHYAFADCA